MNDESDSRMVRLPVRDMRDEPAPQRAASVIQQAIEDIAAFIDQPWSESQDLHRARAALASLRAAQEGGLPPLPHWCEAGSPMAQQMQSYARLALAAAGGGVPQGWRETMRALVSHIERHTCMHEETYRGGTIWEVCRACGAKWADDEGGKPEYQPPEYLERAYELLASSPQPEAAQGDQSRPQNWSLETARAVFAPDMPSFAQPEAAPAVAQVPQECLSCGGMGGHEKALSSTTYTWVKCANCDGMGKLAAAPEAPAQLSPAYRVAPIDPTIEMIDAGAQRLVSWGENSTWPDSWDALQVAAARTEADRCYRSMILVAPGPEAPAQADPLEKLTRLQEEMGLYDEAPAHAAQSAGEVERGDVVAFEFYNRATGHAIVDYSVNTHVGNLSAAKGYEARPLVYAAPRQNVLDGSKLIPAWQAREALDEIEAAARGDAPFNHQAAAVVRAAISHKEQP